MKHIRLFENKNDEFWLVVNVPQTGIGDLTIDMFDDEQSAINRFIVIVNQIAKESSYGKSHWKDKQKEYDDEDCIFTLEDARRFLDEESEYNIYYTSILNNGSFKLPKNLKLGGAAKKYNL